MRLWVRLQVKILSSFVLGATLLVPGIDASAQVPAPAAIVRDMRIVNAAIDSELDVLQVRCVNQATRKQWLENHLARISPALDALRKQQLDLETSLQAATTARGTARVALEELDAAIRTLTTQIQTASQPGAQELALKAEIARATAERNLRVTQRQAKQRALQIWLETGTNQAVLFATLLAKIDDRPLSPAQQAVFQAYEAAQATIDNLDDMITNATASINQATKALTELREGVSKTIQQLTVERNAKLALRPAAVTAEATTKANVIRVRTQLNAVVARIAQLSSIVIPPIHPICAKIQEGS